MLSEDKPRIYNLAREDALEITQSPFGRVGRLFTGEGLEAVWVKKEAEQVDPGWFEQAMVDLLLVVQGQLKVEFESPNLDTRILMPGELLVLPRNTRCRAYRWPREAKEGTLFLAVYPAE